jgi:outer membrane lipoprotein-sorting protein
MRSLLCFILFLFLNNLPAQNVNDIINKVQDKYGGINYLSASFIKMEIFKITGSQSETTGKLYVAKGDKYRFESDEQTIVTDGKSIWAFSSKSNQVIIEKIKEDSPALLPRDILFKYPKKYYSTLLKTEKENDKTTYLLKLDPKEDTGGYIKGIRLWIEKDSWLILKMKNSDTSKKIPDAFFTYTPGEGVEVHDRR